MRRDIVVGDIHGCLEEFNELLERVQLSPGDKVIPVGDLLDKGYDSAGVVARCRQLRDDGYLDVAVCGNHEDKHRRWRHHVVQEAIGGKRNPMTDRTGDLAKITPQLSPDDIQFLDSSPIFYRLSGNRGLIVHAGISPHLRTMPETPPLRVERGDILNTCLWIRCITPHGDAVGIGNERPGDTYWAESYDGRFGHVFFGHQPFREDVPRQFKHATGLDLGCVYGLQLAAAIIPDDGPIEYVTVKARGQHSRSLYDSMFIK